MMGVLKGLIDFIKIGKYFFLGILY